MVLGQLRILSRPTGVQVRGRIVRREEDEGLEELEDLPLVVAPQPRIRVARALGLASVPQDHLLEVDAATVVSVGGRGADAPRDSLIATENLGLLSIGAAFDKQDRELMSDIGEITRETESHSYYGFLSLDVLSWITITGGAGQTEVKQGKVDTYDDPDSLWMWGVVFNIWEQEIIRLKFAGGLGNQETAP